MEIKNLGQVGGRVCVGNSKRTLLLLFLSQKNEKKTQKKVLLFCKLFLLFLGEEIKIES
jgi:hypothetical protein